MRPTDEERREVAARLRVLASHREVDKEMLHDAIGVWPGGCIDGYDPVGVMELADLIEPKPERTCRFEHDEGELRCSSCSEFVTQHSVDEEYFVTELTAEAFEYCPFCGAKVVE